MRNGFPSKELVESLRERYPQGTRVELVTMSDPHTTLQPGDKGTVSLVDAIGTIFVDWDNGSGLGVAYGEDRVRRLEPEREKPSLLGLVEKHKAAAASKPEKPVKEPEPEL